MLTHMLLSGVVLENLVTFWSRAKVVVSVHEEIWLWICILRPLMLRRWLKRLPMDASSAKG
jgi:hypothetical protein